MLGRMILWTIFGLLCFFVFIAAVVLILGLLVGFLGILCVLGLVIGLILIVVIVVALIFAVPIFLIKEALKEDEGD